MCYKSMWTYDTHGVTLKQLSPITMKWLLYIFNSSWKTGKLTRDWKMSTVISIRKPNKPEDQANSYRYISLAFIPCKLREILILQRINFVSNANDLHPNYPAALRKNHCTTDHLFFLTQNIKNYFQCKPTKSTIAGYIYFSNLFDSVWREKLLTNLFKIGIKGEDF